MSKILISPAFWTPPGYFIRPEGVFYRNQLLTRTPIWPSAITSNERGHNWGHELSWQVSEERLQTVVISAAMLHVSNQCFQHVMRHIGVELVNRILKFRQYLFLFCELAPRKIAKPDIWLDKRGYKYKVIYAANI
jgi:hypothetical protein